MISVKILDEDMNGFELKFVDSVSREEVLRSVEKALFGMGL